MNIPVFHGSYTAIEHIDLSKCQSNRDFGRGFYVTKFRHQAEAWATVKGKIYSTEGVVSEFIYGDNPFAEEICKIKRFEAYNEEWLDFVVMNRNNNLSESAHNYDIVEGPVADDKIQHRIRNYLRGEIPKTVFLEQLKHQEETHQICFCTLVSLQTLEKVENTLTWKIEEIGEPLLEALMLDREIDEVLATDIFYTSDTFTQLADVSTELYLRPWHEIYFLLQKEINIRLH
jgi:hypothetical protein